MLENFDQEVGQHEILKRYLPEALEMLTDLRGELRDGFARYLASSNTW